MKSGVLLVITALLVFTGQSAAAERQEDSFEFMVIGCMPYDFAGGMPHFQHLIDAVNAEKPAFTVHVGDTKSGASLCSDEALQEVYEHFMRFEGTLIYSVGDNEWTDCHRENAGGYDPLERLAFVRRVFFPEEQSLGRTPLLLVTQRREPEHAQFVENTRWERGGVLFAGLHVVGSNNNLREEDPAAVEEFRARDAANVVWMCETFAAARARDLHAVALFIQANPFAERGEPRGTGFEQFVAVLREETLRFGKPVILFHADTHYFRIDKPLRRDATGQAIENFTRVETFGSYNMHAVRVTVEPAGPSLFTFRELLVPGNVGPATP